VDALCINQADVAERNAQVMQMRKVYTPGGAKRVVVWLETRPDIDLVLSYITESKELQAASDKSPEGDALARLSEKWQQHFSDTLERAWVDACAQLFTRSKWWSRTWVMQEVIHDNDVVVSNGFLRSPASFGNTLNALAVYQAFRSVQAEVDSQVDPGDRNVPRKFDDKRPSAQAKLNGWVTRFYAADSRSYIQIIREDAILASARINRRGIKADASAYPLYVLLDLFRDLEASDPRDHVFALLGMCTDQDIKVDYGMTVETLYTNVQCAMLRESLDALLEVKGPHRQVMPDQPDEVVLPSWVVDYRQKRDVLMRTLLQTQFNASRGLNLHPEQPKFHQVGNSMLLIVWGLYVGIITEVTETRLTDLEEYKSLDALKMFQYSRHPTDRFKHHSERSAACHASQSSPIHALLNNSWGPCYAAVNDIIVVIAKCSMPLILRPTTDGNYLLVGGCWLVAPSPDELNPTLQVDKLVKLKYKESGFSDIMFGSACENLPDDFELEEFCLC
jgi:hypothetical protein